MKLSDSEIVDTCVEYHINGIIDMLNVILTEYQQHKRTNHSTANLIHHFADNLHSIADYMERNG